MTHNVTDETGVRVMKERCKTCIFRPGNIMSLRSGRVEQMVEEATTDDSAIVCHSTLDDVKQAVCRGFFTKYPTTPLQVADRLGCIVEWERVEP